MKKIFSPSVFNLIGQTSSAFWQWVLTIWVLRTFGTEELGKYTYILSIVSPFLLFSNFQLRNRLSAQSELLKKIRSFLRLRVVTIVSSLVLSAVLIFISDKSVGAALIISVLLVKALESWSEILFGVLQAEDKLRIVGTSLVLKSALAIVLMAGAWFFRLNLPSYFLMVFVIHAFIIYTVEWKSAGVIKTNIEPSLPPVKLLRQDKFLVSLGLMAWLTSICGNWPRYILKHSWGLNELGIFSSCFAIYAALSILINSWLQSSLAQLGKSKLKQERTQLLSKLGIEILAFHILIGLLLIPFRERILAMMFGSTLGIDLSNIILLLVLSLMAAFSTLFSYFLIATGHMSSQWLIMIGSNIATLACGLVFIPVSPLNGALYSLLSGILIQVIFYALLALREIQKVPDVV